MFTTMTVTPHYAHQHPEHLWLVADNRRLDEWISSEHVRPRKVAEFELVEDEEERVRV